MSAEPDSVRAQIRNLQEAAKNTNLNEEIKLTKGDFVSLLAYCLAIEKIQIQTVQAIRGVANKEDAESHIENIVEIGKLSERILGSLLKAVAREGDENGR